MAPEIQLTLGDLFEATASVTLDDSLSATVDAKITREAEVANNVTLTKATLSGNYADSKLHIEGEMVMRFADWVEGTIQASYDEHSQCFVCGNAHESGLGLKSFRVEESDPRWADASPSALRSVVTVGDAYQGLPGIVSTGVMDSLMICHGSWQAAIALMDRAVLPRPPLVMPKSYSMQIHDRLPPGTEIEVTTKAIDARDDKEPYRVRVMMELKAAGDDDHDGKGFVCASSEAMPSGIVAECSSVPWKRRS